MVSNREFIIRKAKLLRHNGFSHRQIAKQLKISVGSAYSFTQEIKISWEQHLKLVKNSGIFTCSKHQRSKWSSRGSRNWLARIKYHKPQLLQSILDFYQINGRIPTKREFNNHWASYLRVFGSWNNAIIAAGLSPNPELLAKKYLANDGHKCDSLSEKIIDDWLRARKIIHLRNQFYPGQKKFTVDFLINNKYWIEFLGLKGELASYDQKYQKKKDIARINDIKIIEIYPTDIFPKNNLSKKLSFLLK